MLHLTQCVLIVASVYLIAAISVFRYSGRNTYTPSVEELRGFPKRSLTTSLQDIQIVNGNLQDRFTCGFDDGTLYSERSTNLSDGSAGTNHSDCARSAMLILVIVYVFFVIQSTTSNTFLSNSTNSMSCTRNPSTKAIFGWTVLYMSTCFLSVNQT